MMDQDWFEMMDIRRRKLNTAVWIPLRAARKQSIGEYEILVYREEFFGAGSVAVPLDKKTSAESLGWGELGLMHSHQIRDLSVSDVRRIDTDRASSPASPARGSSRLRRRGPALRQEIERLREAKELVYPEDVAGKLKAISAKTIVATQVKLWCQSRRWRHSATTPPDGRDDNDGNAADN